LPPASARSRSSWCIALLLSGIGFIVLAAGLLGPDGLRRRRTKTPPPVATTPAAV
jgi:hypothetical protein